MTKNLAKISSLKAFMNSLLRDFAGEDFIHESEDQITLTLSSSEKIDVFLAQKSLLGNHRYTGKIQQLKGDQKIELSFIDFATLVAERLFESEDTISFLEHVKNSYDNMSAVLQKAEDIPTLKNMTYADSEQCLLLGHPIHPYPKAKTGIENQDIQKYSPEFQNDFPLAWISVKEELLHNSSLNDAEKSWVLDLFSFEFGENREKGMLQEGYLPLPLHPWQKERLLEREIIQRLREQNDLIDIGEGQNLWKATSSLRSLYCEKAPYLVKFSMDLKLTNSIRHLELNESIRGQQISAALSSEKLTSFFANWPNFSVLGEPAFLALKDQSTGDILKESIVICRENFAEAPKSHYLLSILVEENPQTGKARVRELVEALSERERCTLEIAEKKWLGAFQENVIRPFLELAAEHGVLLGAHLQNLVVRLEDGLPAGTVFKDCQGTGFSELGFREFSKEFDMITKDNGNILDEENVNKVFLYYLVVNTTFTTISALAESNSRKERKLLNLFRNFIYTLAKDEWRDGSAIDFILQSDYLYQKGNFYCSLKALNETTMEEPWTIYRKIANPCKSELRQVRQKTPEIAHREYIESLGKEITLRPFVMEKDMDKFYEWHHKDYVSEFWELDKPYEELVKLVEDLQKSPYQLPLIYEVDGKQIGYFEVYWAFDDRIAPYCDPEIFDRGFHLLIGEEAYLRSRYVTEGLLSLCHFIFKDDPRTQNIWGEPRSDNIKIRKLAQALPGWRVRGEFDFPHKRSMLLQCHREDFFREMEQWKKK